MFLYAVIAAGIALIAGILLAVYTKKVEGVVYGKLDKAGRITNIVLIPVYIFLSLFCVVLSLFTSPDYDGFLGILGWIVWLLINSAPLYCSLSLGFSASLRKKGKSKPSFIVQFAGVAGCALSFLLFILFYGNLLSSLN